MIAIVNVSTHNKLTGYHDYEVRINKELITTFKHKKEDGLAECLSKATMAVKKYKTLEADRLINEFIMEDNI